MKRVIVHLDPVAVEFSPVLSTSGAFPYLESVGDLRLAARAGHLSGLGVGESPSLSITLSNAGRVVAGIIGRPLRARVDVFEDGAPYFSGYVGRIEYGTDVVLTLEG